LRSEEGRISGPGPCWMATGVESSEVQPCGLAMRALGGARPGSPSP
jgi:hypothetical protein